MEYNLREKAEIVELAIECAKSFNTDKIREWFDLKFEVESAAQVLPTIDTTANLLWNNGQKLAAVKMVKEYLKSGIKEAKEYCERKFN